LQHFGHIKIPKNQNSLCVNAAAAILWEFKGNVFRALKPIEIIFMGLKLKTTSENFKLKLPWDYSN